MQQDKKRAAYASVDNRQKGARVVSKQSNTDRHKITYNTILPSIRDAKSTKALGPSNESARNMKLDGRYGYAGYESALQKNYPTNITSGES